MTDAPELHAFAHSTRGTLLGAMVEAQRRGSETIEAEHLLLALAAESLTDAGRALAAFGLDHAGVIAALETERLRSLAAAGIEPAAMEGLDATRLPTRPRWGASIREAMARGDKAARAAGRRDRRSLNAGDFLIGILSLDFGTVPRALAYAGVDREALAARTRSSGGGDPPRTQGDPAG